MNKKQIDQLMKSKRLTNTQFLDKFFYEYTVKTITTLRQYDRLTEHRQVLFVQYLKDHHDNGTLPYEQLFIYDHFYNPFK